MKATKFKTIMYEVTSQNKYTYKIPIIKKFIKSVIYDFDPWLPDSEILNVFAGDSDIGITNDLDEEKETDFTMDALDFLKRFDEGSKSIVLFDPPFSLELHKKYYKNGLNYKNYNKWISDIKIEIARVLKVGGVVISCGYETNGIGALKGFEKDKLLITAHGGAIRDLFTYTEIKIKEGKHNSTWRNKK